MNTLYIHMGNLKTGSTAIQAYLYAYKDMLLQKHKLLVPNSIAEHHRVYSGEPYYIHKAAQHINPLELDNFKKEIKANPNCNIVISNEWYNGLSTEERDYFKAILPNYQFKVVFYIRRIDSFLKSFFSEQRKRRVDKNLVFYEDFVKNGIDYFTDNALHRINTSIDSIGKNNVIVKLYDRKLLKHQDVVCDFMNILGIDIPADSMKNKFINASVEQDSYPYLSAAQWVLTNDSQPFYTEQYNRIFKFLFNATKAIPSLPKHTEEIALNKIKNSIEKLEQAAPGYTKLYDNKAIDISPPTSSVNLNEVFSASVLFSISFELEKIKSQNRILTKKLDALNISPTQNKKSDNIVQAEELYNKAKSHYSSNEYMAAEKFAMMSLYKYAGAENYILLSEIYEQKNLLHISLDCMEKAIELDDNPEHLLRMKDLVDKSIKFNNCGEQNITLSNFEKLAIYCASAKSLFNVLENYYKSHAENFNKEKKYSNAIAFANKILAIKHDLAWPHYIRGCAYWSMGCFYVAMQELEKAKKYDNLNEEISTYYHSRKLQLNADYEDIVIKSQMI